jgi:hypothetical protein
MTQPALIPFQPPPGLFNDLTPFVCGDRWWTGSNVRFNNGVPEPIGGWTSFVTGLSGVPRNIFVWTSNSGNIQYAVGTTTKLYDLSSGTTDITPSGFTSTARWSLDSYGQTLMASPTAGTLYQWDLNAANDAVEITQAPDVITCMLVRNRQVIAGGCNEESGGAFNGLCVRWCDIEDPTDWTTTATNNAGEYILEGPGRIVTMRKVGDYVAILTTDSLWMMQYVGDPAQTFIFTRVGTGCGCIGLDSVVSANGTLYWMTTDYLFYVWTPGMIPQQMECPVQQTVQGLMNTSKTAAVRTFGVFNSAFNEVWFFFPTGSSSSANPTRYAAVSIRDGTWFLGSLARTSMAQHVTLTLVGADASGNVYTHENGSRGTVGDPFTWSIRSGAYYLDNTQNRMLLRSVRGDFGASATVTPQAGTVTVEIDFSDEPYQTDSFTASATLSFTTESAGKKDFMASGRLATIRISGTDSSGTADTFCRIGKLIFDAVKQGQW